MHCKSRGPRSIGFVLYITFFTILQVGGFIYLSEAVRYSGGLCNSAQSKTAHEMPSPFGICLRRLMAYEGLVPTRLTNGRG